MPPWDIDRLLELTDDHIQGLSDVLIDCVEGGASVSFMSPLIRDRALSFWRRVAQGVAAGELVIWGLRILAQREAFMNLTPINLREKLTRFHDHWSPKMIAELNDYQFKLVKVHCGVVWQEHAETDEAFIVLDGRLKIELPESTVELTAGEMFVVPRGVSHKPSADQKCHMLLIEPRGVRSTGDAGGERPLYAHVAKENIASIRVLEKCGFVVDPIATDEHSQPADGVAELVFCLKTPDSELNPETLRTDSQ